MANQEHLEILKAGVQRWGQWRNEHIDIRPDFRGADLRDANLAFAFLRDADLRKADLRGANLSDAYLNRADLRGADLRGVNFCDAHFRYADLRRTKLLNANFSRADFRSADLSAVNLSAVKLSNANLSDADLSGANLSDAHLDGAILNRTNLTGATLTRCSIYGISVWNVQLEGAKQDNLVITPNWEPTITVDNLEVAQFIYLLLNNPKIRDVIDTVAKKAVLILGRFTPERKAVLDALRDELRKRNYLPMLFDFEKPASRDVTETVSTLAHLARFIIVDLTDPSSAPHEVATVIPQTVVPVQPLLTVQPLLVDGKAVERHEYAMFEDLRRRYHWVLPTFRYQDSADLLASLQEHVIAPAELKIKELAQR
jgi:uncharacterized protein YjbI with pentapeptide repeats